MAEFQVNVDTQIGFDFTIQLIRLNGFLFVTYYSYSIRFRIATYCVISWCVVFLLSISVHSIVDIDYFH